MKLYADLIDLGLDPGVKRHPLPCLSPQDDYRKSDKHQCSHTGYDSSGDIAELIEGIPARSSHGQKSKYSCYTYTGNKENFRNDQHNADKNQSNNKSHTTSQYLMIHHSIP